MQFIKAALRGTFIHSAVTGLRTRRAIRQWTAHDQQMLQFYSQFCSAGQLCFDIGANIGNRTRVFLKMQARVVAVEPQARCADFLRSAYARDANLTVVQKAVGASEGEAEILISDLDVLSSLSPEWIESVRKSGRFAEQNWDQKQSVPMTTLDKLIEQYGRPAFVKIDVEGFESEVIKGLSQPVGALSLEFTPEFIDSTLRCIDHLSQLGDLRLNYSAGESMQLALPQWVPQNEMVELLESFRNDYSLFGDVYVRFVENEKR